MGSEAAPSYMYGCPYHLRNTHNASRFTLEFLKQQWQRLSTI